jgi:MFS family permease
VPWFVATRILGVAASAVAFPLTLAVIRLTFHGRERPLAMLIYTVVSAVALLIALLASVVEQRVGWRVTFVVPTIAGIASFLARRYVPEPPTSACCAGHRHRPVLTFLPTLVSRRHDSRDVEQRGVVHVVVSGVGLWHSS